MQEYYVYNRKQRLLYKYYCDGGMSNMTKLFVTIDVVTVLLVVLCMALVIVRYRKNM